ncbi:unnamed protein product, partial [marine sediment metagenome]
TVKTESGDLSTGTAFHIGDGWLATAAHVVSGGEIDEVAPERYHQNLTVDKIIQHSDPNVDLAILKTNLDLSHYLTKTTIIRLFQVDFGPTL